MQALVRARRARVMVERSVIEDKLGGKCEREKQNLKPLGKENSGTTANNTYSSTEKLLNNRFARQLLESTPKKKPIHIKCDSLRPNSTWKWLERWMSVSSMDSAHQHNIQLSQGYLEQDKKASSIVPEIQTEVAAEAISESSSPEFGTGETTSPGEGEDNMITYDADSFSFQGFHSITSIRDDKERVPLEIVGLGKAQETSSDIGLLLNKTETQPLAISQKMHDLVFDRSEMGNELVDHTMRKIPSEKLESGGKKFLNPAFLAAQSKFEELGALATSTRSTISSFQDLRVESKLNTLSSPPDSVTNSISHDPRVVIGGSECGTELSISSTLDSPDRSEAGGGDCENGGKVVEDGARDPTFTNDNTSNPLSVQPEKLEDAHGEDIIDSVIEFSQLEKQPKRQADRSSPEVSPRSHIAAPESQGTPSSQISVKSKRNKLDKSGSNHNRKSRSADKSSPSNLNYDSTTRSSMEKLPKDAKSGKSRKSFGSRADCDEQEPGDGTTTPSLPSYMQATESARAKAQANTSPRSSPGVQEKDTYIKKRQYFPSANEKQDSPRIQQSISPVQAGVKRNGTHSLHEKKWQR